VTLTVKFDRNVTGYIGGANPNLQLVFGNGSFTGDLTLTGGSGDTYTFTFTAHASSPTGAVAVVISGAQKTASPFETMTPVRWAEAAVFYIDREEEPEPPEPDDPEHDTNISGIVITEFRVHPLFIAWTAQPGVKYWVLRGETPDRSTSAWETAYGPESSETLNPDGSDTLSIGDPSGAVYELPARFYIISTEPVE